VASALVSALHVLALAIGLPAVFVQGRAFVQMVLVVVIVFVASFMARGFALR
jgi:hypothetical protein